MEKAVVFYEKLRRLKPMRSDYGEGWFACLTTIWKHMIRHETILV